MLNKQRCDITTPMAFVINMAMAYVAYFICRVEYVLENWSALGSNLFSNSWTDLIAGSMRFDTSAILYTNVLYAVMMLLPLHYKEPGFQKVSGLRFQRVWQRVAKWLFVIVNSIAIVLNLGDSVYFRFTGRRTTVSVLQEFQNEDNIATIFGTEIISHWYLFLLGMILIYGLWRLYVTPKQTTVRQGWKPILFYYVVSVILFLLYIPLTIAGMRGGFTTAVRPITISNANQYVNSPTEAAAILNTPFSLIRTAGKTSFKDPGYMPSEIDLSYTAVHDVDANANVNKKNIVVIIVESFCKQYVMEGYAPFIKSLEEKSLTFDYSFANGRKSIDAMPSILSSIPMFIEPFFLTPASMNNVSGIAGAVDKLGYQTAFFHGAENGSMGFEAFARSTGFQKYYGRTEYDEDSEKGSNSSNGSSGSNSSKGSSGSSGSNSSKGLSGSRYSRFHGDDDFDGTWAIWDEPFLQYYDVKMSEMKQPFMTAVFTASSHHPFNIPKKYEGIYKNDGPNTMHRCIMYTDMALRKFFETASRQPWYKNTIFVLTCDHTNGFDQPEYGTDMGLYAATLLFYDPTGQLVKPERRHCIAQQIDIMPTVMSLIGYNRPYIAFGQDLTKTQDKDSWAVSYNNGIYQLAKGDYFLQFDGHNITGYYNYKKDPLLKQNLKNKSSQNLPDVKLLKALIQDYMRRMTENRLTVREGSH